MNVIKTFEEHLAERYGIIGSKSRTDFENKAKAFATCEIMNYQNDRNELSNSNGKFSIKSKQTLRNLPK